MTGTEVPTFKALLPTGILFGLGLGNFFGAAMSMVGSLSSQLLAGGLPLLGFPLLAMFLYGLIGVWRPHSHKAVLVVALVGWLAAAPWAAIQSRFGLIAWLCWPVVLLAAWFVATIASKLLRGGR